MVMKMAAHLTSLINVFFNCNQIKCIQYRTQRLILLIHRKISQFHNIPTELYINKKEQLKTYYYESKDRNYRNEY